MDSGWKTWNNKIENEFKDDIHYIVRIIITLKFIIIFYYFCTERG